MRPKLPDDDSDGKKDAEESRDDGVSHFAFVTFDTNMILVQFNKMKLMFPPGIEPGTICVLGRCDNHYTTET